jgi:heat shock protein HslJ
MFAVNRFCAFALITTSVLSAMSGCTKQEPTATPPAQPESAAAPAESAATPSTLTGTVADLGGPEWKLESFSESEMVPSGVTITLAVAGEQLSGNSGCNRYMGSIKNGDAPGKIAIGPLAGTRMACPPPQDQAEARYTKALQHATSFVIQDGRLMIAYQDGDATHTLTYTRA